MLCGIYRVSLRGPERLCRGQIDNERIIRFLSKFVAKTRKMRGAALVLCFLLAVDVGAASLRAAQFVASFSSLAQGSAPRRWLSAQEQAQSARFSYRGCSARAGAGGFHLTCRRPGNNDDARFRSTIGAKRAGSGAGTGSGVPGLNPFWGTVPGQFWNKYDAESGYLPPAYNKLGYYGLNSEGSWGCTAVINGVCNTAAYGPFQYGISALQDTSNKGDF